MRREVIMYCSKIFGANLAYLPFLCFHQGPRYDFPKTHNGAFSAGSWQLSVQPFWYQEQCPLSLEKELGEYVNGADLGRVYVDSKLMIISEAVPQCHPS